MSMTNIYSQVWGWTLSRQPRTHYICESMHCESNQYQIVALQLQHQWLPFHISYCIVTLGLMMKHKKSCCNYNTTNIKSGLGSCQTVLLSFSTLFLSTDALFCEAILKSLKESQKLNWEGRSLYLWFNVDIQCPVLFSFRKKKSRVPSVLLAVGLTNFASLVCQIYRYSWNWYF